MAKERHQQNRPVGDEDLTKMGRPAGEENLVSGGVGPSGSDFGSTGKIGGMGNTSDGAERRRDHDDSADPDHTMGSGEIIDTNLTPTGTNPYGQGEER